VVGGERLGGTPFAERDDRLARRAPGVAPDDVGRLRRRRPLAGGLGCEQPGLDRPRSGAVERLDVGGDRVAELAFGSTVVQRRRERFDAVVPDDVLSFE